jgi:DNA polymerase III sliding clamp (beta) subunit (PCNA family)
LTVNLLPVNLGALSAVCAKESTKFCMTGVRLEVYPDESYRAVATDSKRLLIVEGPGEDERKFPKVPGLASAPNGAWNATIDAKAWKTTFGAADKMTKGRYCSVRHVGVVMGENVTTFGMGNGDETQVAQPRNLEGRYPPIDAILPTVEPEFKISVSAARLASLLEVMTKYCDPSSDDRVTLEFHGAAKPMVVKCQNPNGQKAVGLLMPIA